MSESAKVVPLSRGRRGKGGGAGAAFGERERRIRELEEELERARAEADRLRSPAREGLLVALARVLQAGRAGASWENLARAWSAFYFSWHSEEVDDFGYDPKFTRTILPLFEFLYTMWWRVDATSVENVPADGAALIVANHSGVLPYDGLMINLAV